MTEAGADEWRLNHTERETEPDGKVTTEAERRAQEMATGTVMRAAPQRAPAPPPSRDVPAVLTLGY